MSHPLSVPRAALVASSLVSVVLLAGASVSYYDESLPTTMNPLFASSMVDHRTHELAFDRLFFRSPVDNRMTSRIVQKHEVLDGGQALKVVLAPGITWQDGEKLEADDVCFTIDAMLDPKTPSPIAKAYRDAIAGCTVEKKENAAIVKLTKAFYEPREQLGFAVLPKHMFTSTAISPELDFSSRPIGTGPMKASRGRREVRLEAYAGAHHPAKIDLLTLAEGADPFVQVRTLLNGGVHGIVAVAPPNRPDVAASDDVGMKSYDLRSWWFVAVNTKKGALADKRVREALDLTVDRQELRKLTIGVAPEAEQSPCEFVSGPFVQSSPYYNRSVKVRETADRAAVKERMLAAGAQDAGGRWMWKGAPVTLKIGMNSALDQEAKDLLNQLGNQFQAGGFDRTVYLVTPDEWNRKAVTGQMGDYDLLVGKWSFGVVEDVTPLFHTRQGDEGAYNIFDYSSPEVDALLTRYGNARTDTEARDAFHDLHAYLAEDRPYLFLWKLDTKSAWRNEIRNNTISPYYYFTDFHGWTYETAGTSVGG